MLGCSAAADACVLDQNSQYAWIFGIPVAVYCAALYAFMIVICSPAAWRSRVPAVRLARIAAIVIGMVFVLYLVYREMISLGRLCPWCTSVHVITFCLFVLLMYQAAGPGIGPVPTQTEPAETDSVRPDHLADADRLGTIWGPHAMRASETTLHVATRRVRQAERH